MGGEIILSWQTAGAILAVLIPVLVFLGVQLRSILWSKNKTQLDSNTSDLELLKTNMITMQPDVAKIPNIEDDFKKTKDDLERLKEDLTHLQIQLAQGATSEKLNSINLQITDLKEVMTRFQNRLEKMSDLTIKILNSKNGEM